MIVGMGTEGTTMTTSHETMTDAARRGQEAFTSALRIWADGAKARLHGAIDVVDIMFDFADHLLASQREFTKMFLAMTGPAVAKTSAAAERAAEDVPAAATQPTPARAVPAVSKQPTPARDTRDGAKAPAPRKA